MPKLTCPRCGAQASGNFCSTCGASLGARPCPSCGAVPEPGARFCNACGQAVVPVGAPAPARGVGRKGGVASGATAPPAGDPSKLGWWVAGFSLVALILIIALPILQDREGGAEAPPAVGGGAAAVDLTSMTPRQAADRLYNRVMAAAEAGDSAEVDQFLPMSIAAYDQARPLDADGLYHLSLLLKTGGDFPGALAIAQEALETAPDHLLNLAAAAEAAEAQGDVGTSRAYWGRFLELYDQEMARGLPEYAPAPEGHGSQLPVLRQKALQATGR